MGLWTATSAGLLCACVLSCLTFAVLSAGAVSQAAVHDIRLAQGVHLTRNSPIIHQVCLPMAMHQALQPNNSLNCVHIPHLLSPHLGWLQAVSSQIAEHSQLQEQQRGTHQPQRSSQQPRDAARCRQKANGSAPGPAAATLRPRESRGGLTAGSVGAAANRQLNDAFARAEKRPLQAVERLSRPYPGPTAATQPGLPQAGTDPATQGTPANWNGRWGQGSSHRKAPASPAAPDGACSPAIWQRTQRKAPAGVPGRDRVAAKRSDALPQPRTRHWPAAQGVAQAAAAEGRSAGQQTLTAATADTVASRNGRDGAAAGPQAAGGWQRLDLVERCAEPAPAGQDSLAARGRHKNLTAGAVRGTSRPVSPRQAASACPAQEAETCVSPHPASVAALGGGSSSHAAGEHCPEEGPQNPEEGLPARIAALLSAAGTAAAEADAQALALEQALEMVENQLPLWAHQQNLDWGATAAHEALVRLQDALKCLGWHQHPFVYVALPCPPAVSTASLPGCCPLLWCHAWQWPRRKMPYHGMRSAHTLLANEPMHACDLQVPLVPSLSSLGVAKQIVLNDQQLPVQPLWIAVHQEEDGGAAR